MYGGWRNVAALSAVAAVVWVIAIVALVASPIEQTQKELDAYDAGMNDWMRECTGLNRTVDDCTKAYDGNHSLRRFYMLKHKDSKQ